jgi:hypothetical protein
VTEGWIDRLRQERAELHDKLEKLNAFLAYDEPLARLSSKHCALLIAQSLVMTSYLAILDQRLSLTDG